jgi:hypothetical protein
LEGFHRVPFLPLTRTLITNDTSKLRHGGATGVKGTAVMIDPQIIAHNGA